MSEVETTLRSDEELIEEGRKHAKVIERSQLELGKLVLEYAPIGDPSRKTGQYERIDEYAEAIGLDSGTLKNYRAVASAWSGIDTGDWGYTMLKSMNSVADKEKALDYLARTKPGTKSGRWTAAAATESLKKEGIWSHTGGKHDPETLIEALVRFANTLSSIEKRNWSDEEKNRIVAALTSVERSIVTIKNSLSPSPEEEAQEIQPALTPTT